MILGLVLGCGAVATVALFVVDWERIDLLQPYASRRHFRNIFHTDVPTHIIALSGGYRRSAAPGRVRLVFQFEPPFDRGPEGLLSGWQYAEAPQFWERWLKAELGLGDAAAVFHRDDGRGGYEGVWLVLDQTNGRGAVFVFSASPLAVWLGRTA